MIIINKYYFIGSITFLICANYVYSLSYFKNHNKKYKCNSCISTFKIPLQKIIFLNSKNEINIYKNCSDNSDFILKTYNIDNTDNIDNTNNIDNIDNTDNIDRYIKINNSNDYEIINLNINDLSFCTDLLNKKLIKISPGGLYGFYDAGICSIIKKKYNLNNYIFSGASAGAWNSLFMSYKNDIDNLVKNILDINYNFSSIIHLQMKLKEKIIQSYSTEDFDLKKVFISVCVYDNFALKNYIYTDFIDLEDAVDCCIASSNIPFVTGNLIHLYRNKISFDGGFLLNQTFLFKKPNFEINYAIWGRNRFFTSFFDKANTNIHKTYKEGIDDTNSYINTNILDNEFMNI